MEKVTFITKSTFAKKNEEREVTDSAALQYARLGLIKDSEQVIKSVEARRLEKAQAEANARELSEARAKEKLAERQAELAKQRNLLESARKELKEKIETKEEKKAGRTTKAPKF